MLRLRLAPTGGYFECNGKPFFYLGDTVWAAISRATLEEWEQYLFYRRRQGFNVLQLCMLPVVHDSTQSASDRFFCRKNPDGSLNFDELNDSYFDFAEKMIQMAVQQGFVPELSLIWVNYIANSWAAKMAPQSVMPRDAALRIVRYIARRYRKYQPIYFACGDTDFTADIDLSLIEEVMAVVKEEDPEALVGIHNSGANAYLPPEFEHSKNLDFYTFQSGHGAENEERARTLAEEFSAYQTRPLINSEPCYEGHFKTGETPFRTHSAFDIRCASWEGMLRGAKAGIAYGAHGLWNWHRYDDNFISEHRSGSCFNWDAALRFEGAWDMAFARYIFEQYRLFDLRPIRPEITKPSNPEGVCVAKTPGGDVLAIYSPYPYQLELGLDLSDYDIVGFDLENRRVTRPVVVPGRGRSLIKVPQANADMLYIGTRR